jgi:hypothetical protein
LAIVVGSAVVAIGGGGIKTMQRYWERTASRAEEHAPEVKRQAQQPTPAAAFDDGDAAVYVGATDQFGAQRPSRPRRDR